MSRPPPPSEMHLNPKTSSSSEKMPGSRDNPIVIDDIDGVQQELVTLRPVSREGSIPEEANVTRKRKRAVENDGSVEEDSGLTDIRPKKMKMKKSVSWGTDKIWLI